MGRLIMICECHSAEHQVIFRYDAEFGELYCEPHLTTHRNFLKRLWRGIKYAFGYKSKFGDWDSMFFRKDELNKLRDYLDLITNLQD